MQGPELLSSSSPFLTAAPVSKAVGFFNPHAELEMLGSVSVNQSHQGKVQNWSLAKVAKTLSKKTVSVLNTTQREIYYYEETFTIYNM